MLVCLVFAAGCTAGILYPLDWLMGIRLNREDELVGLDVIGRKRKKNIYKETILILFF